jgi:hypothetical protein
MVNNSHGLTIKMTVLPLLSAAVFFMSPVPANAGSPDDLTLDNVINTGSAILKAAGIPFSFNGAVSQAVAASKAVSGVTPQINQMIQPYVPQAAYNLAQSAISGGALGAASSAVSKALAGVTPYVPPVGSIIATSLLGNPGLGAAQTAVAVIQNKDAILGAPGAIANKVFEVGSGIYSVMPAPIQDVTHGVVDGTVRFGQDVTHGVLVTGVDTCGSDLPVPREAKNLVLGTSIDVYGGNTLRYDQRTEGMAHIGTVQRTGSDETVSDFIVSKTSGNTGLVNDNNREIWNDHRVLVMEDEGNNSVVRQGVGKAFDLIPSAHKPVNDMMVMSIQNMPEEYKTQEAPNPAGIYDPGKRLIVLNRDNAKVTDDPYSQGIVAVHEYGHFYAHNYDRGRAAQNAMIPLYYQSDKDKPEYYFAEDYGKTDIFEDFATMYTNWVVDSNNLVIRGEISNNINNDPTLLQKCDLMQYVFSENIGKETKVNVYDYNGGTSTRRMAPPLDMASLAIQSANPSLDRMAAQTNVSLPGGANLTSVNVSQSAMTRKAFTSSQNLLK